MPLVPSFLKRDGSGGCIPDFLGVFKSKNLLLVKSLRIGEAWDRREIYL